MSEEGDRPGDFNKEFEQLNTDFRSLKESTRSVVSVETNNSNVQKDSLWAWIACCCAVMNQLLIFGTLNVYSLFLVKFQKEFKCSTGEAAWLGSMTMGLMKLFGPLTSSLVLYLNNRVIMMMGAVLCSASIFTSSFAPTFMTLFGTLCVPFALGAAFTITPSIVVPVDYFNKHQSLAMGFVAAGSSVGTLILAPLLQIMLDALNWRTTFRIHSSSLASLVILNCFMKPVEKSGDLDEIKKPFTKSVIQDLALWKNRVFQLWAAAMAIVYFGYQIPNILLVSYAGFLGINPSRASYIVMTMGGATTVSRLITGKILTCQLLSRLHFKQTIFVVMGTSYLLLAHVTNIEGLYVFAVVRGLLDGAHIVMLPMLTASMVGRNKAMLGWGYIAGAISVTYTLGPPLAGYVKDVTGNYKMSFTMAGLPMIASGLLLFWLPWAQRSTRVSKSMVHPTGSLGDTEPVDDDIDRAKFKAYSRASSVEVLELMPLDVPDILMKKSKVSVTHGKSEAANISTTSRKDVQVGKPRPRVPPLNKSLSLPEPGSVTETDKQAVKIHSEPMISVNLRPTSPPNNKVVRLKKRRSGPLMSPSFPVSVSTASGESTMLQGKELRSDATQKGNTLKDYDREENIYTREDE